MSRRMKFESVRRLVRIFASLMSEGRELPDFMCERMSLVRECPSAPRVVYASTAHDGATVHKVASLLPVHANAGGGFIAIGVDPMTMEIVGTGIDVDWLSTRLSYVVDVVPDIVELRILGIRVVVVSAGAVDAPVADQHGNLPLPVGTVNRSLWWQKRETQTSASIVLPQTVDRVRDLVPECADMNDEEVLGHIGAATPNGKLTVAGSYFLAPCHSPRFSLNGVFVAGPSMFDQMMSIEDTLYEWNGPIEWGIESLGIKARPIPEETVRAALVFAIVSAKYHNVIEVSWEQYSLHINYVDCGFCTWELLDLLRALGMSNPRMQGQPQYPIDGRTMMMRGLPGPRYDSGQVHLYGGEPDWNVVRFIREIRPQHVIEQELVMRALSLFYREPYVNAEILEEELGMDLSTATGVISALSTAAAGGEPLLIRHCQGWLLGDAARKLLGSRLGYVRAEKSEFLTSLSTFLAHYGTIRCEDVAALQGIDEREAEDILVELEVDGCLEEREPGQYALKPQS